VDFLVLGFLQIPVTSIDWSHVHVGIRKRMFLGNLMTRTRAPSKREARVTTAPLSTADGMSAEVQAALRVGAQEASGEVFRSLTLTGTMVVECEIVRVLPVMDGLDFQEQIEFTMREV
jgi:hypothetical protein